MKKAIIAAMLFIIPFFSLAVEELILKDGIDLSEQMAKDDIFFKSCGDLDIDENHLYMLADLEGTVFKIEIETGKFVRAIGSRGQGPGELSFTLNLSVKNGRVFVVDRGFGGIKIFTTEGKLVDEFKVRGVLSRIGIVVDDNDHIYLGKLDFTDNSMVSVYDLKGRKLRSFIKHNFNLRSDRNLIRYHEYRMEMDKEGNIYILYPVIQKIKKYTNKGELVWENDIENKLLGEKIDVKPGKTYYKGERLGYLSRGIVDFGITDDQEIIISHSKGGCILDKSGKLKKLIKPINTDLIHSLKLIKIYGNKIINVSNYKRNVVVFPLGGNNEKN